MRPEETYHRAILGFSLVFVVIGLALLVSTLANGGGPASIGFLMGILFVAVGIGRFWISSRSER
jgi:hypothetical protein